MGAAVFDFAFGSHSGGVNFSSSVQFVSAGGIGDWSSDIIKVVWVNQRYARGREYTWFLVRKYRSGCGREYRSGPQVKSHRLHGILSGTSAGRRPYKISRFKNLMRPPSLTPCLFPLFSLFSGQEACVRRTIFKIDWQKLAISFPKSQIQNPKSVYLQQI